MTRVKVCGITRQEDARLAAELGAWAIGLIFHRPSPRACPPDAAEAIAAEVRRRVLLTGVFVNPTLDEVALAADRFSLGMLQLHGDEGPTFCAEAARRTGCRVMKAVRVRDRASVQAVRAFRVDFHLLDAHRPGRRGGTGETFDWEFAAGHRGPVPVVLSGGLTPGNVGRGIEAVRPFAVDSASGTELRPGVKDPELVRAFFAGVEAADAPEPADTPATVGPPEVAA